METPAVAHCQPPRSGSSQISTLIHDQYYLYLIEKLCKKTVCTNYGEMTPYKVCGDSNVNNNEIFKYVETIPECLNPFQ